MELEKEKIEWFNSLPKESSPMKSQPYQRTCPCGSLVFYGTLDGEENGCEDRPKLHSWIELHFGHTGPESYRSIAKPFKYDWSINWKFSYAGFNEFKDEFGLVLQSISDEKFDHYQDHLGNKFVFYPDFIHASQPANNYNEYLYATFQAKLSFINNL